MRCDVIVRHRTLQQNRSRSGSRKWQTEMENKRRQLEDERRALQHLKSKVLRERWLLEGPAGPDQNQDPDQVLSQLEEDEARTRTLEESIRRLEQEVSSLETGLSGLPPEPEPGSTWTPSHALAATTEITGLEAVAGGEPEVAEASAENPVTMVFMGYQEVEDEDQTRKVLGLQGTVKAELVLIDDGDGKVDPPASAAPPSAAPSSAAPPTPTKAPETVMASNGEAAVEGRAVAGKKKQPCKCCSIM
uniref:Paralemmin-1 n=1 Tax=Poecilia latipinna TaxID=48699 RepID=A0A3B3U3W4_9TELE